MAKASLTGGAFRGGLQVSGKGKGERLLLPERPPPAGTGAAQVVAQNVPVPFFLPLFYRPAEWMQSVQRILDRPCARCCQIGVEKGKLGA